MLILIKMHDYAHYVKDVEKLRVLLQKEASDEECVILDFLLSSKETVGEKLDSLEHSSAYMHWVLSDDAQEIVLLANSLCKNRHSENDEINDLICKCAKNLSYLISIKCAQFYTED